MFGRCDMWDGKKKAITFSFDDGTLQDVRLVEILNKYSLKATFNICSALLDSPNSIRRYGKEIDHSKVAPNDVRSIYAGHEVAVHTLTHPWLNRLDDDGVVREIEEDRKKLSELCGYEVVGMAYPFGVYDERILKLIRENTGIKYSRTIKDTHSFEIPKCEELLSWHPSVYYIDKEFEAVVDRFLALESDEPQLLYIWGHSFELDSDISDAEFERICKKLSNRADIFYGTNREVLK